MVGSIDKRIVRITGKSMEPLLKDGDIAFVSKMSEYDVGDIIVFGYSLNDVELLISHRIVYMDNDYYFCKGDNSLELEIITFSSIIGKIVSVERNAKKIQLAIDKKLLDDFCNLSLICGKTYRDGNCFLAQRLAKRCYINMCKIKNSINKNGR